MYGIQVHYLSLQVFPKCKNDASEIVKAGEKLKESKKKAKMASQQGTNSRDWGRVRISMKLIARSKCFVCEQGLFTKSKWL